METHEDRIARLESNMSRVAQLSNQLAEMSVDMKLSISRLEEQNLVIRDEIVVMKEQMALSERRLTLAEERMARHEERMAEIDREAAQTRSMFIRACERLGLFDDDAE